MDLPAKVYVFLSHFPAYKMTTEVSRFDGLEESSSDFSLLLAGFEILKFCSVFSSVSSMQRLGFDMP